MPTLLIYAVVAASIYAAGFGSAWYWQDLRWDAAQKEALEDQIQAAAAAHQVVVDSINKRLDDKQRELDAVQRALSLNLKMLADARQKAEALDAEYADLKRQSQEVRDWALAPIPGAVCRVLDGAECPGGGRDGKGGEVPAAPNPPPGPPGERV